MSRHRPALYLVSSWDSPEAVDGEGRAGGECAGYGSYAGSGMKMGPHTLLLEREMGFPGVSCA